MSKGKILIADDEAAIRSLLKIVVERAGFEADFARDGAEAIAKLSEGDHLVLLLDLMMPNVNGYEVAQHLKTLSRRPAVVVLTALTRLNIAELDGNVVHAIIQKPFDINFVAETVLNLASDMLNGRTAGGSNVIDFRRQS